MHKLLQINVTANSGSHGKIAEEIGKLSIERGWKSVIAYGRWANRSLSELIRVGSDIDIKEHGIESRLLDNQGLASRKATKRLVELIKDIKPDIIHLHVIHGYYINYRILFDYLNRTDIPVVWTLHDCWSFTGHCSHFITAGCDKWKTGCYHCTLKGDYPKAFFDFSQRNYRYKQEAFKGNNNLHLVPVCDWLSGFVHQSFLHDKDIKVIKNGIDLSVFKPVCHNDGDRINILGVSSVWQEDKGFFDFYKLRNQLEMDKYRITLVGLTKKQIASLPSGIIGVERTESVEELVKLYSNADIFINPTYWDTYPTVNLEAMACGTPVLTYNTGGSPEAVTTETGWVVEQGDIDGMAAVIRGLKLKEKNDIMAQRKACRVRAEKEFDKNHKFQAYLDLYDSLLLK